MVKLLHRIRLRGSLAARFLGIARALAWGSSGGGQIPTWSVLATAVIVAAVSAAAIYMLRQRADDSRQAEVLLTRLEAKVNRISSLEWETIAEGVIHEENIQQAQSEVQETLAELDTLGQAEEELRRVQGLYQDYESALEQELNLTAAGDTDRAREFDEERVNPSFHALREAITAAAAARSRAAERANSLATIGSGAISLAAALIIGLLFWRSQAARRATEVASAEQRALRRSEDHFRSLIESASDIITVLKSDGTMQYQSPSVERLLGYAPEELIGNNVFELVHPDDLPDVLNAFRTGIQNPGSAQSAEFRFHHKDGSWRFLESIGRFPIDDSGVTVGIINSRDITERKRVEAELLRVNQELEVERQEIHRLNRSLEKRVRQRTEQLRLANEALQQRNVELQDARAKAATDALTGLSNHRAFHERIREEVSGAQAQGASIGLIMLDIDDFKRFNDSLGHLAGDQILRDLALTVAESVGLRQAYRYGGDEFAVLLPGVDHRSTARTAERLRRAVERRTNGAGNKVTVSLGVAGFPASAASAEELIYGADAAMYWAKAAGRNRVGDWGWLIRQREDGAMPWYAADRGIRAPDVVAALLAALAAKDPATSAHTERCSWYTLKLAEELGLAEEDKSIVRLSALLHDIGKLAVPDEVLFKPGPLNDEEWGHMKQHATAALHVLGQIRAVADATPAILHHHEHFDGSGYPDGLAGDDIPPASRILLVTDAFDAMTTDRPYRKAMPVQAAIDELKRNSGTQFDPQVVEAFLNVLARHGAQPLCHMAAAQTTCGLREAPANGKKAPRRTNGGS